MEDQAWDAASRREFLRRSLAAGVALSGVVPGAAVSSRPAPNVLLVIGDDHLHDWMGHKGKSHLETPHLDRLAAEGWSFPNAFGCAGVCSPARAASLTAKYLHQASAPSIVWQSNSFLRGQTMFQERLHRAGYRTGYVGKFHLGEDEKPKPGFDLWASFPFVGRAFDQPIWVNGRKQKTRGFTDDHIIELAQASIREWAGSDRPFCITVGLKAIHIPFSFPPRLADQYADVVFEQPATFERDAAEARPGLRANLLDARSLSDGSVVAQRDRG